jgi:hypothetical protein
MAKRAALQLTSQQKEELTRISQSRTESVATVRRAKILLKYAQGQRISRITQEMASTRPLVERCIDKALAFGPLIWLSVVKRKKSSPPTFASGLWCFCIPGHMPGQNLCSDV